MIEITFLGPLSDFFAYTSVFSEAFDPDGEVRYDADFLLWCESI